MLPAKPIPDDMIDRVAREVAAQMVAHMEWAYHGALDAVSQDSLHKSLQGVSRNVMAEIAKAAEGGTWEQCLAELRRRRIKLSRQAREMHATPPSERGKAIQ